jgi:hypothetical protein
MHELSTMTTYHSPSHSFHKGKRISPPGRIARFAAVDATANDSEVENTNQRRFPRRSPIHFGDFAFDF